MSPTTLNLTINGETRQTQATTVRALLAEMGLDKQAVAVELNREVVPKKLHESAGLSDGDQLELVTLVGGG